MMHVVLYPINSTNAVRSTPEFWDERISKYGRVISNIFLPPHLRYLGRRRPALRKHDMVTYPSASVQTIGAHVSTLSLRQCIENSRTCAPYPRNENLNDPSPQVALRD